MIRLLLATTNPAKLDRLRWMLEGLVLELVTPADLGDEPRVPETAATIAEVAVQKARAWRKATGLPALATDGGLAVPALGEGWDPLLTRRAAGPDASDEERAAHLLALMEGLEGAERRAAWTEAVAFDPFGRRLVAFEEAESDGWEVAHAYDPRGVPRGFWVPGVMLFGPERRRYGDLSPTERDSADNHWVKLRPVVRSWVEAYLCGQCTVIGGR